ncbi:MAG: methylated-DNA--[protein]-cysteine S-methyltransferase [Rhodospirillales bacterium]
MTHATLNTPLGALTLFEEADALVAIEWGAVAASHATPLLDAATAQIDAYFDGTLRAFDLPLRPKGTVFQHSVWDALRGIGYGRTVTYAQLAAALGSAARAVASACGRNPLPIVVPCHRVIAADGRLGGYSSGDGIDTKRLLLCLEGALASQQPDFRGSRRSTPGARP